jgi:hypothetical protein
MRIYTFILVGILGLTASACSHVQPYQRGKLAHYTMTEEGNGPAAEHVYSVQEGAAGGGGGGGSGCGCN